MKKKILITFKHTEAVEEKAHQLFEVIPSEGKRLNADEILSLTLEHQVDALLVSHGQKFDEELINKLPSSVKVIATSSVGFDHLDLGSAKNKKITLTNTPDVLSDATATLTMMLMLNVSRRAREYMDIMNEGWRRSFGQSEMLGMDLNNKTLAIFGMGAIGRDVAHKARAFGMKIIYCNRRRLSPELEEGAQYYESLEKMIPHADVLSLHAPATSETMGLMNKKMFSLMKKTAIFINVARGNLVDEAALQEALENNQIFGAGLDVFVHEPDFDQKFLNFKNVFLTPHMGSATIETRNAMGFLCLENIQYVLEGKKAKTEIQG